jgi:hypothetical protein
MLRNFYYIDEKGKDQGINGVSFFLLTLVLNFDLDSLKSVIVLKKSLNYCPTWTQSALNGERRKQIKLNTLELVMMVDGACLRLVHVMAGLEVTA